MLRSQTPGRCDTGGKLLLVRHLQRADAGFRQDVIDFADVFPLLMRCPPPELPGYVHTALPDVLFALWHHLHVRVTLVAVDECLKRVCADGVLTVSVHSHTTLHAGAPSLLPDVRSAPVCRHDHRFQVIDATFEVF